MHDKRIERFFVVVYDEVTKRFLASSVGASLKRNWTKRLTSAAMFNEWTQAERVLKQNGFENIKIDL